MGYWEDRDAAKLKRVLSNARNSEKYITSLYKDELSELLKSYTSLTLPYLINGELDMGLLNKARVYDKAFIGRFQKIEEQIYLISQKLSEKEVSNLLSLLTENYKYVILETFKDYKRTPPFNILNESAVTAAVKTNWISGDFSNSIWNGNNKMRESLRRTLSEALLKGQSPTTTARKFRDVMGVSLSESKRLIRTETMATYTKANLTTYKSLGVLRLQVLVEDSACPVCQKHDNDIVPLAGARPGIELSPYHPNCTCSFIGISEYLDTEV